MVADAIDLRHELMDRFRVVEQPFFGVFVANKTTYFVWDARYPATPINYGFCGRDGLPEGEGWHAATLDDATRILREKAGEADGIEAEIERVEQKIENLEDELADLRDDLKKAKAVQ